MHRPVKNVALIGATGALGSHILRALANTGYAVTAVQRRDSAKPVPLGVHSVKVDLSDKDQLLSAFEGMDAVVSVVPNPILATEKIMIDAAIEASVKRIIPSEFSTNMESTLARKLPILLGKSEVRDYLTSALQNSSTTWTSVNNGPFFEMCLKFGSLGPNIAQKTAVFRNGGENIIGTSRVSDIALAVAKVLEPMHFEETANKAVYIYSAAISERYLTRLASEITGIEFSIAQVDTEDLFREANEGLAKGDKSRMALYYFQMMYGRGYNGDTRKMSWNERLGLQVMTEDDLKELITRTASELGVLH